MYWAHLLYHFLTWNLGDSFNVEIRSFWNVNNRKCDRSWFLCWVDFIKSQTLKVHFGFNDENILGRGVFEFRDLVGIFLCSFHRWTRSTYSHFIFHKKKPFFQACGFEILVSQAKPPAVKTPINSVDCESASSHEGEFIPDRGWHLYLESLKKRGYFEVRISS